MSFRHTGVGEEQGPEPRYDAETLRKVTTLAQRLQVSQQETFTAGEMEEIGREVGIEPSFLRRALRHVTAPEHREERRQQWPERLRGLRALDKEQRGKIVALWWATGWAIIPVTAILTGGGDIVALTPFIYVVGGIIVTFWLGGDDESQGQPSLRAPAPVASGPLRRSEMLETLFTLQHQLESQKQRRAFLSVDVVDSSDLKRQEPELAVEYSFGKYRQWVETIVHEAGGELQSHAGDGMMCLFPSDAAAAWTARRLMQGLGDFNASQNRLSRPFEVRCGVSAGEVALEPGVPLGHLQSPVIDEAARLQKAASPNSVVVSGEVRAAALAELDGARPERIGGEAAFVWRA